MSVFLFVFIPHPGTLQVSFLAVGNGDAILVTSPTGTTVLIDAGPDASILRALGTHLSYWDRTIDAVITLDDGVGARGGLAAVRERYSIGTSPELHRGMRLLLGGGVYMDVLAPVGGSAAVVHLVYGNTSFLFSGDLSASSAAWLTQLDANDRELQADVLQIPHEGGPGSVTDAWLAAVQPKFSVISVGAENRYGYPATSTLSELQNAHAEILRTDEDGTITFVSDGVGIVRK